MNLKPQKKQTKLKGENMTENLENIVDIKIHSKPQAILKRLLSGDYNQILQLRKNSSLFKRLGVSRANNEFYNPLEGA